MEKILTRKGHSRNALNHAVQVLGSPEVLVGSSVYGIDLERILFELSLQEVNFSPSPPQTAPQAVHYHEAEHGPRTINHLEYTDLRDTHSLLSVIQLDQRVLDLISPLELVVNAILTEKIM